MNIILFSIKNFIFSIIISCICFNTAQSSAAAKLTGSDPLPKSVATPPLAALLSASAGAASGTGSTSAASAAGAAAASVSASGKNDSKYLKNKAIQLAKWQRIQQLAAGAQPTLTTIVSPVKPNDDETLPTQVFSAPTGSEAETLPTNWTDETLSPSAITAATSNNSN